MTGIPSDLGASAAQAGYQSESVSKVRDANRTGQAATANRQIKSVDEASGTVDTTDDDTQVFTNSEGSGSQGRELGEEQSEEAEGQESKGITEDDQGQLHLDLEA